MLKRLALALVLTLAPSIALAAPAVVQSATEQAAASTLSTTYVALPAAPTVGANRVEAIAFGAYSGTNTPQAVTMPAGWTAVAAATCASGTVPSTNVAWRVATSADTGLYTTITANLTHPATSITVANTAAFTIGKPAIFEPGTANEEKLNVSAIPSPGAPGTLTIAAGTKDHLSGTVAAGPYTLTTGVGGHIMGAIFEVSGVNALAPISIGNCTQTTAVADGGNFDYTATALASQNAGEQPMFVMFEAAGQLFTCLNRGWAAPSFGTINSTAGWYYNVGPSSTQSCFAPIPAAAGANYAASFQATTNTQNVSIAGLMVEPAAVPTPQPGGSGNGSDLARSATLGAGNGSGLAGGAGNGGGPYISGPLPNFQLYGAGNGAAVTTSTGVGNGGGGDGAGGIAFAPHTKAWGYYNAGGSGPQNADLTGAQVGAAYTMIEGDASHSDTFIANATPLGTVAAANAAGKYGLIYMDPNIIPFCTTGTADTRLSCTGFFGDATAGSGFREINSFWPVADTAFLHASSGGARLHTSGHSDPANIAWASWLSPHIPNVVNSYIGASKVNAVFEDDVLSFYDIGNGPAGGTGSGGLFPFRYGVCGSFEFGTSGTYPNCTDPTAPQQAAWLAAQEAEVQAFPVPVFMNMQHDKTNDQAMLSQSNALGRVNEGSFIASVYRLISDGGRGPVTNPWIVNEDANLYTADMGKYMVTLNEAQQAGNSGTPSLLAGATSIVVTLTYQQPLTVGMKMLFDDGAIREERAITSVSNTGTTYTIGFAALTNAHGTNFPLYVDPIGDRQYGFASWALSYDPNWSVLWAEGVTADTDTTANRNNRDRYPEQDIDLKNPLQTATGDDITTLKDGTSGTYFREFANCGYQGVSIGRCAVVVNPRNATTSTGLPTFAHGPYAHIMVLDDLSEFGGLCYPSVACGPGAATFTSTAIPANLPPQSAIVVVQ